MTSTYVSAFKNLINDAWYAKHMKKLKRKDYEFCLAFLEKNADDDIDSMTTKINRLFIGMPDKSPQWALMSELLTVSVQKALSK